MLRVWTSHLRTALCNAEVCEATRLRWAWESCYPALAAKTETRRGWGTNFPCQVESEAVEVRGIPHLKSEMWGTRYPAFLRSMVHKKAPGRRELFAEFKFLLLAGRSSRFQVRGLLVGHAQVLVWIHRHVMHAHLVMQVRSSGPA